jgi:ribosomal protein S18 acetylase RimI-like enzyme
VHGGAAVGWAHDRRADGTYNPLEVGRLEMLREDTQFGWRSAIMAEADGEVAGMLLGYRKADEREAVPADVWAPLRPIEELEAEADGRWFISMVGVHKPWRGKGVGSVLLDHADAQARATQARGQALIVEDANDGARRLYEGRGFRVTTSRPMVPFPGTPQHGTDWLLMVKE